MVNKRLTTFLARPILSKRWVRQEAYVSQPLLMSSGLPMFRFSGAQRLDCVETVFSHHFLICVPLLHQRDSCESLP